MTTKIKYKGPLRSPQDERGDVEIADAGIWARYGEPIEVDDELAGRAPRPPSGDPDDEDYDPGDPGTGLLAQTGNWVEADVHHETTVSAVLSEVGDNPERARVALASEQARGEAARKTLVAKLVTIIETGEK